MESRRANSATLFLRNSWNRLVRASRFRTTLARGLSISYLLVSSLAVLALGLFGGATLLQENRSAAERNAQSTLSRLVEGVHYRMAELERISAQMVFAPSFQRLLNASSFGPDQLLSLRRDVMPFFSNLFQGTPMRANATLFLPNSGFPRIVYSDEVSGSQFRGKSLEFETSEEACLALGPYYPDGKLHWRSEHEGAQGYVLSFGRRIQNIDTLKPVGYFRGLVLAADLFQSLEADSDASFFVEGKAGNLIYPSVGRSLASMRAAGARAYSVAIPDSPWSLVIAISPSVMRRGVSRIVMATLLTSLGVLVLVSLFGLGFARYFNARIGTVVRSIRAFAGGDYKARIPINSQDELGEIAEAFNGAATTIDELIRKVYESELERRDVELRLLQSQLNPHFLYNSLSSVSRFALMGKRIEAHQMVLALARFYRLALNEGKDRGTLRLEFERIEAYLEIQLMRHGGKLVVETDYDEALAEVPVPHLVLQPFVENSIEHAWKEGPLRVEVSARREGDRLALRVEDDGAGMSREQVEGILGQSTAAHGYGIFNIIVRLRLQYGEGASVAIESEPNRGTNVELLLPVTLDQSE
jgi:two-component system, sensor histidine kinase YesM